MTLGRKIAELRARHQMSQGDLAEKMNVSRQSVSKWETDTSVPDLDKLILLSDLFGISLDELARDGAQQDEQPQDEPTSAEPAAAPVVPPSGQTQRTIGFILLAVGLLGGLLALVLSGWLLVPAGVLIVYGVLCLTVKKHVGLLLGWLTFLPVKWALPRVTGTSMRTLFYPYYYEHGMWIHLAVSAAMWVFLVALTAATVHRTKLRGYTALIVGWVIFWQFGAYLPFVFYEAPAGSEMYRTLAWLALTLLIALLGFTIRALVVWQRGKAKKEM